MAYNPGIEQDDEQQQGQDQGADAGTNQLGGGSGVITGQTSGQAQKQKGSGFVNIGQYLGANQADLAGQTDKAIGKVNEGYTAANQNLASSQAAFNTSSDQSRATLGDASTTDDDKQFASDWLKNSKLDNGEQQQFASWQNMNYQGPNELQNTWSADQKKADDLAGTLQSANGYFPAMEQIFGNGRSDYGTGAQRLDASLMAADKTGRERIDQNTKQQQASLGASIQQATEQANAKAAQYRQEADSGKAAAWEALNGYMPEYANSLAGQVAQTNEQRRAEYEAARVGGGSRISGTAANTNYHQAETGPTVDEKGNLVEGVTGWEHPETVSYSYVDPTKANYTTYGGDVGIGSLDDQQIAKLEALYSMTGDPSARSQIENSMAETLGFSDVMRGGGAPSYMFDETTYNTDRQQAINSAIAAAIAADAERERQNQEFISRVGASGRNAPVLNSNALQIDTSGRPVIKL